MTSPGDYSFLLQQVEGDINDNISSLRKRYRNNDNDNDNDNDIINSSLDIYDKSTRRRSSISVRECVKTDELIILIEKLEEQLNSSKDENERLKERNERQLIFLETENKQLKKLSEEKSDKYYEEKKKWQSKLRTLEAENNSLIQNEKKVPSTSNSSSVLNNSVNTNSNNENNQRNFMNDMENRIKEKCSEVKILSTRNAELQSNIKKLEQDLLLANANITTSGSSFEDVIEVREMTKKCSDLESSYRRKTRECERFEQQLSNQQLLKDEITALNSKLKAALVSSDKLQELESICQALTREKRQWVEVFQDIQGSNGLEEDNDKNSNVLASASTSKLNSIIGDVNPMTVLRSLSSTQKRCALLLKTQGELESSIAEQRVKLSKALSSNRESENKYEDAAFEIEGLESRLALAQQQVRLYEGEVTSLRALLESFDSEFKIGKPDDSILIKSKDNLIASLRKELDECRKLAKSYATELEKTSKVNDKMIESNNLDNDELLQINEQLRSQVEKYKKDFHALTQISGLDFIPQNTKVLHLVENPSTKILQGKSTISSLPKEQIKHLRSEIKKIRTDNAVASDNSDTRMKDTMNTSTAFGGADSSKLNQRLKEMFKERIASFREAVYLLTGYKIDLYAANNGGYPRLRLRSMYAEDPDDSLLFQWRDNALELMETPFATKLDQKLFDYLSTCNSVPAFLSNITMDLFDNQTFR